MHKRVCNGTLEEFLGGEEEREVRGQIGIEYQERRKEALYTALPRRCCGVVPFVVSLCQRQCPVEQVAEMC
jgi:hypothetical protein